MLDPAVSLLPNKSRALGLPPPQLRPARLGLPLLGRGGPRGAPVLPSVPLRLPHSFSMGVEEGVARPSLALPLLSEALAPPRPSQTWAPGPVAGAGRPLLASYRGGDLCLRVASRGFSGDAIRVTRASESKAQA